MAEPTGAQLDALRKEQVYTLVGFWLEALIYGAYVILFIAAISISLKQRKQGGAFSMVFFLSQISMFIMITIYTSINLYRAIQGFALVATPPMPINYYKDFSTWDNFAFVVIVTLLVWHADALVIYRCFVIWNRNLWIILVPCALLLLSFVVNCVTITTFKNPNAVPPNVFQIFLTMVYPVNLAQNILTTGFITYRIWKQHKKSLASGLNRVQTGMSLLTVIRIIIESALIFTVQQIILLTLQEVNSPAGTILHQTLVPSIGIVFVLMTLRTHIARTESEERWTAGRSGITSGTAGTRPNTTSVTIMTTRSVTEDHQMDILDSKVRVDGSGNSDLIYGERKRQVAIS